ncbi:MAG: hypothetical protein C0625_15570 [Arcobacter sp.]|nr:MAG: hypothetical protein C0625_15570 [Arcobacter sp.]
MEKIFKIIFGITFLSILSLANDKFINQSEFENKTIFIDVNSYKILQFNKRIKSVEITNSDNIIVEILENTENPLTRLKVYAKEASNETGLITFQDDSIITVGFNIVPHLKNLINMAENRYPELNIEQINDTIFLKGNVPNQKDKDKILDMFSKFDIDPEKKIVDMLSTSNPKMIKIKLYAVEINNDKGVDIKNNWTLSRKNFFQSVDTDGLYQNNAIRNDSWGLVNNQRNIGLDQEIDVMMKNALSLTGGLSGAANYLGKFFNTSLTLKYLADEGVANVLDESTLITLENKQAVFKAGGELNVRLQSDEKAELQKLYYGVELTLTAKEVMNDEFVHLTVTTKARELDWANQVDNIPAITNKSIETTVIIKNNSTIVLGGIINSKNTKDLEKIPLLGEIPILGFLFKSSSFKEGKSELVFFITPEIVSASSNNQMDKLKVNKKKMFDKYKKETKEKYLDMLNINFGKIGDSSEEKLNAIEKPVVVDKKKEPSTFTNLFKSNTPKMTQEEIHKKQVDSILGY